MNNKITQSQEDKLIRRFISENRLHTRDIPWFTRRVVNRLPQPQQQPALICLVRVMITLIAVVTCCALLYYAPHKFLHTRENILSGELLCMYIALMSTVLLVVLQVIQLIKTYF